MMKVYVPPYDPPLNSSKAFQIREGSSADSPSPLEKALNKLSFYRLGSDCTTSSDIDQLKENDSDGFKGSLGLNLLHTVPEPLVDFIFIHGLGGGSKKTWAKTSDPTLYWPKEWLPQDPEFSCVRVHSFGYKADWAERTPNFLNIHDFALALLGEIQCNPDIRRSSTKLVLVAHSMGGIVAKKTYILAREDPSLKDIAERFHTLYFLATPHRGADLAKTLSSVLKVSFGQKPFVSELKRNSSSIQSINDSFRHIANDVQLWSFYEARPCSLPLGNAVIVDKASATLGLPRERCSLLNADHRGVCKFDSPNDTNYRTIRNAFVTTVDAIRTEVSNHNERVSKLQYSRLVSMTGIKSKPLNNLLALEDMRVPGSCEWLSTKEEYTTWKLGPSSTKHIFWLTGNAGCGKSVLSGYVINELESTDTRCSYFHFKHGDSANCSITMCLRSLAFQMIQHDQAIVRRLPDLSVGSETWDQLDERTLWRKVFQGTIFCEPNTYSHYWVIDALDECPRFPALIAMLAKVPSTLRIFLTSRETSEINKTFDSHKAIISHYRVLHEDTKTDLRIYIQSRAPFLPGGETDTYLNLRSKILERADGSFLWTSLVVRELEGVYSQEAAEEVLDELPVDMNDFYARMLESIPERSLAVAHSIFKWALLSMKPLTMDELKTAICWDTRETIKDLATAISSISGQLIRVNRNGQTEFIHHTARVFLLQQTEISLLAVAPPVCHNQIATSCLTCLNHVFGKGGRSRAKLPRTSIALGTDMLHYAAFYFFDHMKESTFEAELWHLLLEFLKRNVLYWIEFLSQAGKLHCLVRAAKILNLCLVRHSKCVGPLGQDKETIQSWIDDLIRLHARFGHALAICPAASHTIIPALCPAESMVAKTYGTRPRGVIVKGLTDKVWDECVARIDYPNSELTAVTYGERFFAIATPSGKVFLHFAESTELAATLSHDEWVDIIHISPNDAYLASSSLRTIRIWDLQSQTQIRKFDVQYAPLALEFADDNTYFIAATRANCTITWELGDTESEEEVWSWGECFGEATGQKMPAQPPAKVAISKDSSVLAIDYRGKPVYLIDTMTHSILGSCTRFPGRTDRPEYALDGLIFNPDPDLNVLVVSYGDGGLALFDQWTGDLCYNEYDVFAHTMACSPDGRLLITASAFGEIKIFHFTAVPRPGLTPIYKITSSAEESIYRIAFSHDSQRFVDILRFQCRIWEPSLLVGEFHDEDNQGDLSQAFTLQSKSVELPDELSGSYITAVGTHPTGNYLFCGRENGTVSYFDVRIAAHQEVLYRHVLNVRITAIAYCSNSELLVTADEAARILLTKIKCTTVGCELITIVADVYSDSVVRSLLLDSSGTWLAVQGIQSVCVWTTSGILTRDRIQLDETVDDYTIRCHPSDRDTFLVIGPNYATAHRWNDDLSTNNMNTDSDSTCHEGSNPECCHSISTFASTSSRSYVAAVVKSRSSLRKMQQSQLMLWDASMISTTRDWPDPITFPGFEHISCSARQIICVAENLLVFLDKDLWVCSLDVRQWLADRQDARRHFFLLSEWKGFTRDFLIEYLPVRREFVVVKKHEVLVIRRGLDIATLL